MPSAEVWTDGSVADSNPSTVGCGAALVRTLGRVREVVRVETGDSIGNGRMEMLACIAGLEVFSARTKIDLYSDAQFISQAFVQNWMARWEERGWERKNRKTKMWEPIPNRDLWERLILLDLKHDIAWHHVKGHAGDEMNERVHVLAKKTARHTWEDMRKTAVIPRPSSEEVERLLAELPPLPMPPVRDPVKSYVVVDTEPQHSVVSVIPCTLSEDEKRDGGKAFCERVAWKMNGGKGDRYQAKEIH